MARVFLVAGLGFGDEGKGGICDYLVRREKASLVVRYNGAAQAAHNVVTDDGRHHTFAQFGSGTFAGARTFLSRYMIVNPFTLMYEAKGLEKKGVTNPLSLVSVEKTALVTSPFHMAANRMREMLRGDGRHGSCGMGVGETVAASLTHPSSVLRFEDIAWFDSTRQRLNEYRERVVQELTPSVTALKEVPAAMKVEWDLLCDVEYVAQVAERFREVKHSVETVDSSWLRDRLKEDPTIVFEGAQGVLLDQDWGFAPYHTWTDCTFGNASRLIEGFRGPVHKIGVLRGYMTRHGAGPLVTEDPLLKLPDDHNGDGPWQKAFRVGHFDLVAGRYALNVIGGVHEIAMTCLDRLPAHPNGRIQVCDDYFWARPYRISPKHPWDLRNQECLAQDLLKSRAVYGMKTYGDIDSFLARVEHGLSTRIGIRSYGPRASDKRLIEATPPVTTASMT